MESGDELTKACLYLLERVQSSTVCVFVTVCMYTGGKEYTFGV